jgi:alpha-L-fucosidase
MSCSPLPRKRSRRPEQVFGALLILLSSCSSTRVDPPAPEGPLPTEAQLAWHRMEMNAFIHFTINTFTNREWGNGDESPSLFNPSSLDVDQWVSVLKEAGFNGIILTAKHHDGFCLWPSRYTDHSIAESPYAGGKGDIVKAVSDACKRNHIKFGVYLSPWDRNHPAYGTPGYITYYRNQLQEIFHNYGPVFEMWFDGANGGSGYYGGSNETRRIDGSTYYDWPGTISMVKQMEPSVIFFSDAGPGVRWVGNERGIAGETNWNTISTDTLFAGKAGIERLLNTGSENGTSWVPAETDVSIRPGWFYHQKEDSLVKSPQRLFEIYLTSVGRGSTLLLNVPPDRRGLIHEKDQESLRGFRRLLNEAFATDFALNSVVTADKERGAAFRAVNAVDGDPQTYWATADADKTGTIEVTFPAASVIKYVVLQEFIELGQRVKMFEIHAKKDGKWISVAEGTTIGYKRIVRLPDISTDAVKVVIKDAKACPLISTISVY